MHTFPDHFQGLVRGQRAKILFIPRTSKTHNFIAFPTLSRPQSQSTISSSSWSEKAQVPPTQLPQVPPVELSPVGGWSSRSPQPPAALSPWGEGLQQDFGTPVTAMQHHCQCRSRALHRRSSLMTHKGIWDLPQKCSNCPPLLGEKVREKEKMLQSSIFLNIYRHFSLNFRGVWYT